MLTYCFANIKQVLPTDDSDIAFYIMPNIPKVHVIRFLSPLNSKLP